MPFVQQLISTAPRVRRPDSAPLLLWARVLLTRTALDRSLARDGDAALTAELALRSTQLRALTTRRPLGRAILTLLERADSRRISFSSAAPIAAEAIAYARPALIQLAVALQSPEPASAQGVAQVLELLRDASGPVYASSQQPSALYFAARRALLAMRPCGSCAVELVEPGVVG